MPGLDFKPLRYDRWSQSLELTLAGGRVRRSGRRHHRLLSLASSPELLDGDQGAPTPAEGLDPVVGDLLVLEQPRWDPAAGIDHPSIKEAAQPQGGGFLGA